jgi:UDP-glucose:(heptosyl)LPS alpha-1,3-glucosyltransferase
MMLPDVTLIKSELFRTGGLEKYTWQLAQDFCSLGAKVTLLTSGSPSSFFEHPLLKVVSLPTHSPLSVINVLQFDKACNAYLVDHRSPVIFSLDRLRFQTHIRAGNGVHAAYLQRRKQEEGLMKKLSFAINPLHRTILSLEKKAFEHPDLKMLFTNSEMVKKEILQFYNTDPQKIHVVHNGVEWNGMRQAFENWEVQRKIAIQDLHLDPQAFQFLFIGHNYHRKGLEKLLYALSLLKQEHFQLSVVGKEKDPSHFIRLIQKLGLSEKVFIFGPQKETLRFYQLADCSVIPSLYDPFANVTVEALAMGVFVLSSKHNGGHEVLTDKNGLVIDDLDDAASFAETLKTALNRPKTFKSATAIRQSVKHLDFSNQLRLITQRSVLMN